MGSDRASAGDSRRARETSTTLPNDHGLEPHLMLDDRIKARILADHTKLTADGKLLSRTQLDACYRTFRSRFGPDVLAGLDGEELLEAMHAHGNRDSLVYWLEFKNDEEFPAKFGSILGGTSFKFGVFRFKETGGWVTGSPQKVI